MTTTGESCVSLAQLLTEARVDDDVADHFMSNLGMSSLADFAKYFSKLDYEEELKALLDDIVDLRARPLQVARLRAAWLEATRTQEKVTATHAGHYGPLAEHTRLMLQAKWEHYR